jgi:hypothetical protein
MVLLAVRDANSWNITGYPLGLGLDIGFPQQNPYDL